jgi:hypothetical protein
LGKYVHALQDVAGTVTNLELDGQGTGVLDMLHVLRNLSSIKLMNTNLSNDVLNAISSALNIIEVEIHKCLAVDWAVPLFDFAAKGEQTKALHNMALVNTPNISKV